MHRDIKPGNVLLTEDGGQVKVTDFGIAQAVSTEEGLTMAGSVMGTAAYFSPEQAEGAVVDGRSDIYSLGVVLYEMLAGRTPFVGDSPVAVASMHVRNEPPLLRDLNPAVPEALEQVTMQALAKAPEARYQTADELREDLVRFAEGRPVLAGAAIGGAAVGTTSVMGAASITSTTVLPERDTTSVVPAVAVVDSPAAPPPIIPPAADDDDAAFRPRRQGAPPAAWIAIVLAVALVLVGFFAYRVLAGTSGLTVPNVANDTQSAAKATLTGLGLKVTGSVSRQSPIPVGIVIRSVPGAGTPTHRGAKILLIVSSGPSHPVTVPPVTGLTLENADLALSQVGLKEKTVQTTSWTAPVKPGTVLLQSPPADATAQSGTPVTLTFLTTDGTYPVPMVVGETTFQAGATLATYGLSPGSDFSACSSSVATGDVISTNPAVGSPVSQGDSVDLTTSSGQCPVPVPDVISDTISLAQQTLTSGSLDPVVLQCPSGETAGNTVASQDPTSSHPKVPPGTKVYLTPTCTPGGSTGPTGPTGPTGASLAHDPRHGHHHAHGSDAVLSSAPASPAVPSRRR